MNRVAVLLSSSLFLFFFAISCAKTPVFSSGGEETVVSVKQFGAIGNGRKNETAAFAAAIKFVATAAKTRTLFIPPGEYLLDSLVLVGLRGVKVEGSGSDVTRLVATGQASRFIAIGKGTSSKKAGQRFSVKHCHFSRFRIESRKSTAATGLHLENCQDNIFEQIEISAFATNLRVDFSWINSFVNLRIMRYKNYGAYLGGLGMNANRFDNCRATSATTGAVAYRVGGNSVSFNSCTAEGGGVGWHFEESKLANLYGCHSEAGNPFMIGKSVGVVNVSGHFIWKPNEIWTSLNGTLANNISMQNCHISSYEKKKDFFVPARNSRLEGNEYKLIR